MSVKTKLTECLNELSRADYSSDETARRSDAAAQRLLALVWEGALTRVSFSGAEQEQLRALLAQAAGPLRARVERLACTFRTRLEDSLLRERSSLQYLLDGFAGREAASQLRQAGLGDCAAILDEIIARWRDESSDSDDEPKVTQPHRGVPTSHTWWNY